MIVRGSLEAVSSMFIHQHLPRKVLNTRAPALKIQPNNLETRAPHHTLTPTTPSPLDSSLFSNGFLYPPNS